MAETEKVRHIGPPIVTEENERNIRRLAFLIGAVELGMIASSTRAGALIVACLLLFAWGVYMGLSADSELRNRIGELVGRIFGTSAAA